MVKLIPNSASQKRFHGIGALICVLAVGFLAWFGPSDALTQEPDLPAGSEDCMDCHEIGPPDPGLEEGDPPTFDAAALLGSVHTDLECVDCHSEIDVEDLPHDELSPVECGDCHGDIQEIYDESLHGIAVHDGDPLAPRCASCHGNHDIATADDPEARTGVMSIPLLCGQCHKEGSEVDLTHTIPQDSILFNYSQSIHGEGLFQKGLVVTAVCTSCHTAHSVMDHTDPRSTISSGRIVDTCTQCHARIEEVHRKVIRGELWEKQPHIIPACVDCHSPHKIRKVYYDQGMADRDCMRCHSRNDLVSETGLSAEDLFVDADELAGSRHARVACVQCHIEGNPSLERPCSTVADRVDCSICHPEVQTNYVESVHGRLAAANNPDAPMCNDCHATHGTLGKEDLDSPIYSRNIPALCAGCHRSGERAAVRYQGEQTHVIEHYTESIHGKGLLESGLTVTANCANCHTAHNERPSIDPTSSVHRDNVADTCAQCHRGIYELFEESIHSPTVYDGDKDLPTCSDCHSAHTIGRTDKDNFKLEIMSQCGHCHEHISESYFETYHGKVSTLGYTKTAKCYDCHGAHDILPTWNPKSHLSRERIVETCAQCHPGSNRRFAGYLTHATHHDPDKYPFLFYAFWGMTMLLVCTLAVAGLHTVLWIPKSIEFRKLLKKAHAGEEGEAASGLYIRRFNQFNSRLHIMVIVSFFALAITGMILKFSYTGWARLLARVLGGYETAGTIHRAAAIVTFLYFVLHLWDVVTRKRKEAGGFKKLLLSANSMLPNKNDGRDFVGSIKWFVGAGPRPEYGRWTYWEKFDYFAVFWGVAIIGCTGLLLWFPEFFTRFIPGQVLNVATIIHSDEALLAVGFIFTIHFFNTHFRPEKFPMDPVIFTGRIPLEEFKLDRPREYKELVESGRLEEFLDKAPSRDRLHMARVFGFTALAIGITLIVLIVYAALYAYR